MNLDHVVGREAVSLNEAARLLDVSRWTIYRLVKDGKLEVFSVRGCRRIAISEIQRFRHANIVRNGAPYRSV